MTLPTTWTDPPHHDADDLDCMLANAFGMAVERTLTPQGRRAILKLVGMSREDFDETVTTMWYERYGHMEPKELAEVQSQEDPLRN